MRQFTLQNSGTSAKNTWLVRNVYYLLDLRSALSPSAQSGKKKKKKKQDCFGELKWKSLDSRDSRQKDCWPLSYLNTRGGSDGKESSCNEGNLGSIPGLGRSPGGGHGNRLQYSCLENPLGGLQSMGSQRAGRDWGTKHSTMHSKWLSKMILHMKIHHQLGYRNTGRIMCKSSKKF